MRLGTRGSALALAQAQLADAALGGGHEIVPITTFGDRHRAAEDKAKWVRELERALLEGDVDVAVHSAKDVPAALPDGLALVGALDRDDPRDALCGRLSGRIGTASPRRAAQLRALDPSLDVVEIRGNVDTRLRKLADGEYDGIVLALAGLRRLGRADDATAVLDILPAAGQGTVVLEARAGLELGLAEGPAWDALTAERAVVRQLGADCHSAVAAHFDGEALRAWVGREDGSASWSDELGAGDGDLDALGAQVARRLLAAGAGEALR